MVVHAEGQRRWSPGSLEFREQGRVRARVPEVNLEAVSLKLEVVEDTRPQEAEQVGGPGELVARDDLFGDGGSTDNMATFQNTSPIGCQVLVRSWQLGLEEDILIESVAHHRDSAE